MNWRQALREFRPYAIAIVPFLLLACILLSSRGIVVIDFLHDFFIVLDGSWRTAQGQIPHVDFHSPIGQAYFWPFAVLAHFGDMGVATLLRADVLVATFVVALSLVSLRRRLSPLFFGLAVLAMATVAMTPRSYNGWIDSYSFLAPYNSWAWALILPMILIALVPPARPSGRRAEIVDGVVMGVLLALLCYLKLTCFLPAVGFLVAGVVLRHTRPVSAGAAALTFLLVVLAVEAGFHNNLAYWDDIRMASQVNLAAPSRLRKFIFEAMVAAAAGVGFLGVLALWDPPVRSGPWLLGWWRPLLVVAMMVGGGAVIATQNYQTVYNPLGLRMVLQVQATLICGAMVAGGELVRRRLRRDGGIGGGAGGGPSRPRAALGWAGLVFAATLVPVLDAATIVGHALASRSDQMRPITALDAIAPELLVSALVPVGQANIPVRGRDQEWWAAYYTQQVEEAVALLKRNRAEKGVILAADFGNPYPMLFKAPSPRGALLWWHLDRSYSVRFHPPAEPILRSATVILESKSEEYGAPVRAILGAEMTRDFRLVDESPLWRLWVKPGTEAREAPAA